MLRPPEAGSSRTVTSAKVLKTKIMLETNFIIKKTWEWIKFIAWLPYLFVTLPWQLRKTYGRVMDACSFNEYRDKPVSGIKDKDGIDY
jgi:hypothetical protein